MRLPDARTVGAGKGRKQVVERSVFLNENDDVREMLARLCRGQLRKRRAGARGSATSGHDGQRRNRRQPARAVHEPAICGRSPARISTMPVAISQTADGSAPTTPGPGPLSDMNCDVEKIESVAMPHPNAAR